MLEWSALWGGRDVGQHVRKSNISPRVSHFTKLRSVEPLDISPIPLICVNWIVDNFSFISALDCEISCRKTTGFSSCSLWSHFRHCPRSVYSFTFFCSSPLGVSLFATSMAAFFSSSIVPVASSIFVFHSRNQSAIDYSFPCLSILGRRPAWNEAKGMWPQSWPQLPWLRLIWGLVARHLSIFRIEGRVDAFQTKKIATVLLLFENKAGVNVRVVRFCLGTSRSEREPSPSTSKKGLQNFASTLVRLTVSESNGGFSITAGEVMLVYSGWRGVIGLCHRLLCVLTCWIDTTWDPLQGRCVAGRVDAISLRQQSALVLGSCSWLCC